MHCILFGYSGILNSFDWFEVVFALIRPCGSLHDQQSSSYQVTMPYFTCLTRFKAT